MRIQSKHFTLVFWLAAVLLSLILSFGIATRPEDAIFWACVALITYLLIRRQQLALYVFIFLPVAGELFRLPWGPENGILISDLLIPVFIAAWILEKIILKKPLPRSKLLTPVVIFTAVAALSLLQAFLFLKSTEILFSSLYLIRFFSYTLLYLVVLDGIKSKPALIRESSAKNLLKASVVSALLIAVAGFIQLAIYPDLGKLEEYGWDPHINRLVSTWLDPNFAGGLFAFMICLLLGVFFYVRRAGARIAILASIAVLAIALFLTYSRSAYLALAVGIIVLGLLKSRRLLIASLIIFLAAMSFLPRAGERMTDMTRSVSSFIFNTSDAPDPTARLRVKSWEQTWELIGKRPILGSGYNTLRYVKFNEGFVTDPKIHSASGSDSSLLTVLAATGMAGIIPFIWFYLSVLAASWRNLRADSGGAPPAQTPRIPFARGFSLGMFAAVLSLMTHSMFVNSLLFPQILIFTAVQIGIQSSFPVFRIKKV